MVIINKLNIVILKYISLNNKYNKKLIKFKEIEFNFKKDSQSINKRLLCSNQLYKKNVIVCMSYRRNYILNLLTNLNKNKIILLSLILVMIDSKDMRNNHKD